jgi:hypothetical protein
LSSAGDLELFKPLTDDDHTDVTAGKRGKAPALAIQVKTALSLTRQGAAVARLIFPKVSSSSSWHPDQAGPFIGVPCDRMTMGPRLQSSAGGPA